MGRGGETGLGKRDGEQWRERERERERDRERERERYPPLNSAAAVVSDLTQAPIMTPCSQLLASNTKGTPVGQPPLITGTGTGTGIRQGSILTKTATAHNLVQHVKYVSTVSLVWIMSVLLCFLHCTDKLHFYTFFVEVAHKRLRLRVCVLQRWW